MKTSIFERIKELGFPEGQYVVVGSAIMEVKGIREAGDLDIVVTPELFEVCKQNGWQLMPWTKKEVPGKPWLKKEGSDLAIDMAYRGIVLTAEDLIRESEIIQGIAFITLERLVKFKREWARPRDFQDIERIEQYLAKG